MKSMERDYAAWACNFQRNISEICIDGQDFAGNIPPLLFLGTTTKIRK